jgi:hypothetical protein
VLLAQIAPARKGQPDEDWIRAALGKAARLRER